MAKVPSSTGPWMAAAVVLVAVFMYWLYSASSSTRSGTTVADTTVALPVVPDTAFASNPQRYANRRVMVRPVMVDELLGRAALLAQLPGREDYPMILDRVLLEQGVSVVKGDDLVVAGQVFALNDSILDVWGQRGVYQPQNREQLRASPTFFLVDSLDFIFPGEGQPAQQQGAGQKRPG